MEFVVIKIGKMDDTRGLVTYYLDHARMRVTQSVHPKTGDKIEVAATLDVEKKNSLTPHQCDGVAAIGWEQKVALALGKFFEG